MKNTNSTITINLTSELAAEITAYVAAVAKKTKLTKDQVVSNLLFDAVRTAKKQYPAD